jgi:cation diffusion facilitator family transporter
MDTFTQAERTARSGVVTCGAGLAMNIVCVVMANSLVLVADFFNSLLEFISITLSWLTLRAVRKDSRAVFNYGLGKIENIASLFIALFMLFSVVLMAFLIAYRMMYPVRIAGVGVWLGIMFTLIFGSINGNLWVKARRQRRSADSPILETQARLFLIKTLANGCMFLSFTLGLTVRQNWVMYLDPLVSGVTVGFMIQSAWLLFRRSVRDLLDCSLEEPLQLVITRELVRFFDEYTSLDGVRSRYSGRKVFIELFLGFEPHRTISEIQQVTDDITQNLEAAIPHAEVVVVPRSHSITSITPQ